MEYAVFKAGLEQRRPMIWVKPYGPDIHGDNRWRVPMEQAIADDRLLVVSPFGAGIEAPSVRRAAWCNQYVLTHCDRMVVGHLNPDGMLACILAEADPDLEIVHLHQ